LNLKAIAADPNSPDGHIGMAFVYRNEYRFSWHDGDRAEVLFRAVAHAEKALELDPANYSSHYARGAVHLAAGELDMAIVRYERSIALNSSATNVMMGLVNPLVYKGRIDEGVALVERAMLLDPHHADWYHWTHAWALQEQGNCEAARAALQRIGKLPNDARLPLAVIQVCLGRVDEAQATMGLFMRSGRIIRSLSSASVKGPSTRTRRRSNDGSERCAWRVCRNNGVVTRRIRRQATFVRK
jgi:tetratricopeptide (TPR) repeat protein